MPPDIIARVLTVARTLLQDPRNMLLAVRRGYAPRMAGRLVAVIDAITGSAASLAESGLAVMPETAGAGVAGGGGAAGGVRAAVGSVAVAVAVSEPVSGSVPVGVSVNATPSPLGSAHASAPHPHLSLPPAPPQTPPQHPPLILHRHANPEPDDPFLNQRTASAYVREMLALIADVLTVAPRVLGGVGRGRVGEMGGVSVGGGVGEGRGVGGSGSGAEVGKGAAANSKGGSGDVSGLDGNGVDEGGVEVGATVDRDGGGAAWGDAMSAYAAMLELQGNHFVVCGALYRIHDLFALYEVPQAHGGGSGGGSGGGGSGGGNSSSHAHASHSSHTHHASHGNSGGHASHTINHAHHATHGSIGLRVPSPVPELSLPPSSMPMGDISSAPVISNNSSVSAGVATDSGASAGDRSTVGGNKSTTTTAGSNNTSTALQSTTAHDRPAHHGSSMSRLSPVPSHVVEALRVMEALTSGALGEWMRGDCSS